MSNMQPPFSSSQREAQACAFQPGFEPRVAIAQGQQWMGVSQLQKSIRRGDPEAAVEWAWALWNSDRAYGIFRMAVVAAEEIAGADPALARAFLESGIKKTWFEERGGFRAFAYFADAFARSPKDRASCDLASTASLARLDGLVQPSGPLDYKALREVAIDPQRAIPARLSALWLLAGTQKCPNPKLGKERPGRLVDFLGACDAICPDGDLLACVDLSLRVNKEPNPIGLTLCRAAQTQATLVDDLEIPTDKRGQGLLCAVDAHTREGRDALAKLIAQSPLAQSLCAPMRGAHDKSKLLGSLFFHLEGHDVAPRLDYPLANKARQWHRQRLAGLAQRPQAELFEEAKLLLPELNELRLAAAPWAFEARAKTPAP
jgi:hypothetical protein